MINIDLSAEINGSSIVLASRNSLSNYNKIKALPSTKYSFKLNTKLLGLDQVADGVRLDMVLIY